MYVEQGHQVKLADYPLKVPGYARDKVNITAPNIYTKPGRDEFYIETHVRYKADFDLMNACG